LPLASDAQGRLIAVKTGAPTGLTRIVADLPLGPGPTLYTRIGDAFAWLCLVLSLSIAGYCAARGKRNKGA
jgi:apolipoprotein N-acyltransferase